MGYLDGSCDPATALRVEHHLDSCSSCLAFYHEQLALTALLRSVDSELEPPEHIWYRIESRIEAQPKIGSLRPRLAQTLQLWGIPSVRYALGSAFLLLVVSGFLLRLIGSQEPDRHLLAQLDAYVMPAEGNPFLSRLQPRGTLENPFFSIDKSSSNPFEANGSLR
jgi:hypothetical protein